MLLDGEDGSGDFATNMSRPAEDHASRQRTFQFIPKDLATKCRKLIESYHAIYGYVALPDMLWLSDARELIESHKELTVPFKKGSKSRGAKRANELFLLIATTIVSLEVLARDFAGWGKRFPAAKHAAESLLGGLSSRRRTWLMDLYLYPPLGVGGELPDVFPEFIRTGRAGPMNYLMRTNRATGIAFSASVLTIVLATAATQAAATSAEAGKLTPKLQRRAIVGVTDNSEQRHSCSWVGPGGRAIYVCR